MDRNKAIERIKLLSNANGISGFEDDVLSVIKEESAVLGRLHEDSLRNLYIYRNGGRENLPVVQLDAHSDELGFMIKAIRPDGMLEFITIGGWVASSIPAHMVRVKNREGIYIPGIISSIPPHFMNENDKKLMPEITSMTIDVGATSAEEIINDYKIDIAAPVTPEVVCSYNEKTGILMGKAFDNRLGCAAIIEVMEELENEILNVNITAAFAAQEEVGTRGAVITANLIKPDIAIVFEGCPADDTAVLPYQSQTALRRGPMLRHIDAKMITNPRFQKYALEIAKKFSISCQSAVRTGGCTNGAAIHLSNMGVPTIVIGIPVRYAHTHYGISSYYDFEKGVRLAVEILKDIKEEIIKNF